MVSQFGTVDYIVFIGMLVISIVIGVFYAIKDRSKKNLDNYNYGGKNMSPFAVGMSISVSIVSAVSIISGPTEAYLFGTIAGWYIVNPLFSKVIAYMYYAPLIHRLQLATIYQILALRFHTINQQTCTIVTVLSGIFYNSISIYIPALSLNAVAPIGLYESIVIVSVICTFYTTVGGIKAVIWTDVAQTVVMVAGSLAAMIKTIVDVAGFYGLQQAISDNNRNNFFDFNPNPMLQRTFWTIFVGLSFNSCFIACCSQSVTQRYLCCKSLQETRKAILVSNIPGICFGMISFLTGLAMYAYFQGCDPVQNGEILVHDQLMPLLVVKIFQNLPGLAGLFVAAAFSGTLSTVSSGINSISLLILECFIVPCKPNLSEKKKLAIGKILAVLLGGVHMAVAFLITLLDGTVVSIVYSVTGSVSGPVFAVFTLGIFTPWCNYKGAFVGQIIGTACSCWIIVGSTIYGKMPESERVLPLSVDQCDVTASLNSTTTNYMISSTVTWSKNTFKEDDYMPALYYSLYSLSFGLYFLLGFLVTFFVGLLVSFATGANKASECNPKYFLPLFDNEILPEKIRIFFRFGVSEYQKFDNDVEKKEIEKQTRL